MANKSDEYDPDVLLKTFPNVAECLSFSHPAFEAVKDECLIVLDASVLLLPYESDLGESGFEELTNVYAELAKNGRLLVPAQALREFVKRRGDKICELLQMLDSFQIQSVTDKSFPLQESFEQLRRFAELRSEANEKIKECRQSLRAAIEQVQKWNWNDPVSEAYRRILKDGVIYEPKCEDVDVQEEVKRRFAGRVPPGYEDGGRPGDFLIWQSLKEVATRLKCASAFVTKETKKDWVSHVRRTHTYSPSLDELLLPRFELVDEFRRTTNGKPFFVLPLHALLMAFGVKAETVEKVKEGEWRSLEFDHGLFGSEILNLHLRDWRVRYLMAQRSQWPSSQAFDITKRARTILNSAAVSLRKAAQGFIVAPTEKCEALASQMEYVATIEKTRAPGQGEFWDLGNDCFDQLEALLRAEIF